MLISSDSFSIKQINIIRTDIKLIFNKIIYYSDQSFFSYKNLMDCKVSCEHEPRRGFFNVLFLCTSVVGETHNDGVTGGEVFFMLNSTDSISIKQTNKIRTDIKLIFYKIIYYFDQSFFSYKNLMDCKVFCEHEPERGFFYVLFLYNSVVGEKHNDGVTGVKCFYF